MTQRHKILIVDDEASLRYALRLVLNQDYDIFEAEDIQSAASIIRRTTIDVVLLDVEFPQNDNGIDAIEQFYHIDSAIQIVMVTGYEQYQFEAARKRAFGYMVKPINHSDLCEVIQNLRVGSFR